MCGIFAIYCPQPVNGTRVDLETAKAMSRLQSHRGPDYHGYYQHPNGNTLCHERLAIVDLSCTQPIQGSQPDHQVIHNGEIYNHEQLRHTTLAECKLTTECDSEVIIWLWEALKWDCAQLCNTLHGVFSFTLIAGDRFLVARDPIGVKPLYYGKDSKGRWYFSSEMKVIEAVCGPTEMAAFPPGHYWEPESGFVQYYKPAWFDHLSATNSLDLTLIREALIQATHRRLMSDAPIGVLLSGGLDSSLVSSIAYREKRRLGESLRSFSIGLDEHAPDLQAARKVAAFLGTEHHEFHFTVEEGLSIIHDLIYHLETYDITSIRASTPMYFLSRKIREMGVVVVLSGEGADEIFGGYLYFHNAPNDEEFQKETIRRVQLLSTADCLRADKSCMANAVEVRVPFLDRNFLDVAMLIEGKYKQPKMYRGRSIEKWPLRAAFDVPDEPYLPDEILWRQKEQFSDGVGYSWIDSIIDYCSSKVNDEEMKNAAIKFPHNTPTSKEAYYMRNIFAKHFPSDSAAKTVHKWIPKWQTNTDPSGRACQAHNTGYTAEQQKKVVNGCVKDIHLNGYSKEDKVTERT